MEKEFFARVNCSFELYRHSNPRTLGVLCCTFFSTTLTNKSHWIANLFHLQAALRLFIAIKSEKNEDDAVVRHRPECPIEDEKDLQSLDDEIIINYFFHRLNYRPCVDSNFFNQILITPRLAKLP